MEWILLIVAIIVIVMILLIKTKKIQGIDTNSKYYSKKPLSDSEQVLYHRLKEALPQNEILAQVSFSRFIYTKGSDQKENLSLNNRSRQKVIDFLICKPDFSIEAAIELDDSTHIQQKDEERDKILNSAGLRIIRWNVKNMPSKEEITATFGNKT